MCWGGNHAGQLGDGLDVFTNSYRSTPTYAISMTGKAVDVVAGGNHTCVLLTDGKVQCWGYGSYAKNSRTIEVAGLDEPVVSLSANGSDAFAVLKSGAAMIWSDTGVAYPLQKLKNAQVIAGGGTHICVLKNDGNVACWGANGYGQIGIGNEGDAGGTSFVYEPTQDVVGIAGNAVEVSAGGVHTCARLSDGTVRCWGSFGHGQLGPNAIKHSGVPIDLPDVGGKITKIVAGGIHNCILIDTGEVKCWGNNRYGQLGNGTTISSTTPRPVIDIQIDSVQQLDGRGSVMCVLLKNGSIQCWGDNSYGESGDGSAAIPNSLVSVSGLVENAIDVSTVHNHTCVVTKSAGVKCWGEVYPGGLYTNSLGDGTTLDHLLPVDVVGLTGISKQVVTGMAHACVLTTSGGVKCWGQNAYGQLGDGTTTSRLTPVDVSGLTSGVVSIQAGYFHNCALTQQGAVKCWGSDYDETLGNGSDPSSAIPVTVLGLDQGVATISGGPFHTCALTVEGGMKCWGDNDIGRLGSGNKLATTVPTDVVGLSSGVIAIGTGVNHSCAILSTRTVKCWGHNYEGVLGDGTRGIDESKSTPVDVLNINNAAELFLGSAQSCVKLIDNTVQCWGMGFVPPGVTKIETFLVPVDFSIGSEQISKIVTGLDHSCLLTLHGSVQCWDRDNSIHLGIGTAWRATPVLIAGSNIDGVSNASYLPLVVR